MVTVSLFVVVVVDEVAVAVAHPAVETVDEVLVDAGDFGDITELENAVNGLHVGEELEEGFGGGEGPGGDTEAVEVHRGLVLVFVLRRLSAFLRLGNQRLSRRPVFIKVDVYADDRGEKEEIKGGEMLIGAEHF